MCRRISRITIIKGRVLSNCSRGSILASRIRARSFWRRRCLRCWETRLQWISSRKMVGSKGGGRRSRWRLKVWGWISSCPWEISHFSSPSEIAKRKISSSKISHISSSKKITSPLKTTLAFTTTTSNPLNKSCQSSTQPSRKFWQTSAETPRSIFETPRYAHDPSKNPKSSEKSSSSGRN